MSLISITSPELPAPNYEYVTDELRARTILSELSNYSFIEVDTEGTSLDPFECKTTLIQIGIPGKSYVFDVRSDLEFSNIHGSLFEDLFTDPSILKLLQNCNYDMKVLKQQFGYYINNVYDTMLAEQLSYLGLHNRGFSLAALVKKYLNLSMDKEPRNTFKEYGQKFTPTQLEYAAKDVCILDIIRNAQWPRISKYNLEDVLQLEMEFTKPLAEMELNGIKLDVDKWRIIISEAEAEASVIRDQVENLLVDTQTQTSLFGIPIINIDSPQQLLKALRSLGLNIDNTDVGTLSKFENHYVIEPLLKYRKLNKLITTYGEALIEKIHPATGRLHSQFKQMVSTGRMSSNEPNLQNIPAKQMFRSCFVAEDGNALITDDMSSAELKIMGNMSGEPNFIKAYRENLDLHRLNASNVFKVPYDEVTTTQRKASKAVTFGLCVDEDTQIFTDRGLIKIKHLTIGTKVKHDLGFDEVIDHKYMGEKPCFEVIVADGSKLVATEGHIVKCLDSKGVYIDKTIKDLKVNVDSLCDMTSRSYIVRPLLIREINYVGKRKVYDISVANHPYYLANGFVVHNCYGMSAVGLANRLSISKQEAENIINSYFEANTYLADWLHKAEKNAIKLGYSESVSGRKRFYNVPPYNDPNRKRIIASIGRQGMNQPVQGSNADTIKKAMVLCVEKLEKLGYGKLLLTVHDELIVESPYDKRFEVAKVVSDSLIEGFGYYFDKIPMEADAVTGPCWIKSECEGCGGSDMVFIDDKKYKTKLSCAKCGQIQD